MEPTQAHKIDRKPISTANAHPRPPSPGPPSSPGPYNDVLDDLIDGYADEPPPYSPPRYSPPRNHATIMQPVAARDTNDLVPPSSNHLTVDTQVRPALPPRQLSAPPLLFPAPPEAPIKPAASAPVTPATSATRSLWKTAFDETIYFAGGLISRPSESTRHHSVMRHSSGLIFYKGSSTSVAITIFSDAPLPPGRTLWLQRRGFSGDLGMNASVFFGSSSNWVDVTPVSEALPADLPEGDERVWQRDIKKFLKKAASHRHLSKQLARETCVVRIPAAAEDGYLRILVCASGSKKVLCPSPVFRVASASSDLSVMRGASLATMPLEMGLKVVSVVGEQYVNRIVGPVTAVVGDRVKKLQPNFRGKDAVKSAIQEKFSAVEERYAPLRANTYDPLHTSSSAASSPMGDDIELLPELIGSDEGPEEPFPIALSGRVVGGTGKSRAETGFPTANLSGVPNDLMLRLGGIYIGWAAVQPMAGLDGMSYDWHEAIITVGPPPHTAGCVAPKNIATVHIIHDFGSGTTATGGGSGEVTNFVNASVNLLIMGFMRSAGRPERSSPRPREELVAAAARDIDLAVLSLSRESWRPQTGVRRVETARSQRSFADIALEARSQLQRGIDSVPFHRLGVRTEGARLKDEVRGVGGVYIRR